MDGGPEPIGDDIERLAVARQARRVHRKAAVLGALLTAVALALPA